MHGRILHAENAVIVADVGLAGQLQQQDASAVAVKEVRPADLPSYRGQQGCQEGYPNPGELLGQH